MVEIYSHRKLGYYFFQKLRIVWFRKDLKRPSSPTHGQECLSLKQVAQSLIQSDLEHFQA